MLQYKWDSSRTHAEQLKDIQKSNKEWKAKYLPHLRERDKRLYEERNAAEKVFLSLPIEAQAALRAYTTF